MSLQPGPVPPVPETTAYVARAAFPDGNPYLRSVRDSLGTFYDDERFADLFPDRGQPAETPWRLALVTVLQFAEGLSDRQAADAVRGRIDWKYALGLELTDPGFDFSVLCEFRARLVAGGAERLLLEAMLETCKAHGLVKARTKQRTDSTHVLAAIRTLNRLELVGETLRAALNSLATVAPAVAAVVGPARVVRPLCRAGRGVAPAQGRGGPLRPRRGHRRRRLPAAGSRLRRGGADVGLRPGRCAARCSTEAS